MKNDLKLEDLFNSGKYDIVFESGALILKSNRHRLRLLQCTLYLQIQLTNQACGTKQCNLVIWSLVNIKLFMYNMIQIFFV